MSRAESSGTLPTVLANTKVQLISNTWRQPGIDPTMAEKRREISCWVDWESVHVCWVD